jgi:hypothetical protein
VRSRWGPRLGRPANFLRHGLGSASRDVVEKLVHSVTLEPWGTPPLIKAV